MHDHVWHTAYAYVHLYSHKIKMAVALWTSLLHANFKSTEQSTSFASRHNQIAAAVIQQNARRSI